MGNTNSYKTRQREVILNYLVENKNNHVTVGKISDFLESNGNHVGVTTIYRHLDKLLEQGLVKKYTVDGTTSACFQYSGDEERCDFHYHLKCNKCGRLIHMDCSRISELCRHIMKSHGFSVDLCRTVFYGVCQDCKEKTEVDQK